MSSSLPDIENDSFDDEDELVFAVKIKELINPEYVEFTRTKRVKILKPLLQRRRDAKDFVKELEEEMMGSKKQKWTIEQSKIINEKSNIQNRIGISDYFKNRQMSNKQSQIQSQTGGIQHISARDDDITKQSNMIKGLNLIQTIQKSNTINDLNKKISPTQNYSKGGLQASIERQKNQLFSSQKQKPINSTNQENKNVEPKIIELEENDDIRIIESENNILNKNNQNSIKIEETKWNSENNKKNNEIEDVDTSVFKENQTQTQIKEESKNPIQYINPKFNLTAKLEKVNRMFQNAKRELMRSERNAQNDSDSSSKNFDSNKEEGNISNDNFSESSLSSEFAEESNDNNESSLSRSIDMNENSFENDKWKENEEKPNPYNLKLNKKMENYFKTNITDQKNLNTKVTTNNSQTINSTNGFDSDAKSKLKNLLSFSRNQKIKNWNRQNPLPKGLGWQDIPFEIDDDSDDIQVIKMAPVSQPKQTKLVIQNDKVAISSRWTQAVNPVSLQCILGPSDCDSAEISNKNESSLEVNSSSYDRSNEKMGNYFSIN